MPHRCVKCGKEYPTNECEILKGCRECGGKKFIFIPVIEHEGEPSSPAPLPERVEPDAAGKESPDEMIPAPDHDRLESVRIVSPGTYELNIEKLASSDERVVGVGKGEGSYLVDLLSLVKPKKKKTKK